MFNQNMDMMNQNNFNMGLGMNNYNGQMFNNNFFGINNQMNGMNNMNNMNNMMNMNNMFNNMMNMNNMFNNMMNANNNYNMMNINNLNNQMGMNMIINNQMNMNMNNMNNNMLMMNFMNQMNANINNNSNQLNNQKNVNGNNVQNINVNNNNRQESKSVLPRNISVRQERNILPNENMRNIRFDASTGIKIMIKLNKEATLEEAIKQFVKKLGLPESVIENDLIFLFNGSKIDVHSKKPIKTFQDFAAITVFDQNNVIGAN